MKINEVMKQHPTFSFEVFPPKADQPMEPLYETLTRLYAFQPDFISCTYGAGGSNKGRNLEVVSAIQKSGVCPAMAHFTCIGSTKQDVRDTIRAYRALGVKNVLALRGDFPKGQAETHGDFAHADALIGFVCANEPELCIACAGYPEGHLMARSLDDDIRHLRGKQDNGASFVMTQLCHDVGAFSRYVERIRAAGVTLPVEAGVMPVLNKDAVIRMTLSNGCSIPAELAAIIGRYGDDPDDFRKAGKEFTARQFERFTNANTGGSGLHIYTMNRYRSVSEIIAMSGVRPMAAQ